MVGGKVDLFSGVILEAQCIQDNFDLWGENAAEMSTGLRAGPTSTLTAPGGVWEGFFHEGGATPMEGYGTWGPPRCSASGGCQGAPGMEML